jgi:hypothetical protein
MTLEKLNTDFNTSVTEDDIDTLATFIYSEIMNEHGSLTFNLHGFQGSEFIIKYVINYFRSNDEEIDELQPEYDNQIQRLAFVEGLAKLIAQKLRPTVAIKLGETQIAGAGGSSSIESAAPEHTIEVVNGQETKTLQERLELRKQLNKITDEALRLRNLKEKISDDESDYSRCRYKLQQWTNGGTPYVDENGVAQTDGEKDGPSSYEAWRAGMNSKKRDARLKLEKEERESIFTSPKHTTRPNPKEVLDDQSDAFLAWYIDKFGE